MYISEHVVHIRHQLTTVGRAREPSVISRRFFSLSPDDDEDARARSLTHESTQRKQCIKGQATECSLASLFLTVIVAYDSRTPITVEFRRSSRPARFSRRRQRKSVQRMVSSFRFDPRMCDVLHGRWSPPPSPPPPL